MGFDADINQIDAEENQHQGQKKTIAAAFSRKWNVKQEDLIVDPMRRFLGSLKSLAASENPFDIIPMLQNTILDIVTRHTCREDLRATECGISFHPLASNIDYAIRISLIYVAFRPVFAFILDPTERVLKGLALRYGVLERMDFINPLVKKRLKLENNKPEYSDYL